MEKPCLPHLSPLPVGCWTAEVMAGTFAAILNHEVHPRAKEGRSKRWKNPESLTTL